jgi:N-acetylneuraminic acid mutarotase
MKPKTMNQLSFFNTLSEYSLFGRSPCRSFVCCALALTLLANLAATVTGEETPQWQSLETINKPHARHEAAFVECGGRLYLLGGRGIKPVDIFDPETRTWSQGSRPPVEIHHFQPVVWQGKILLAGAMTGAYPHETALDSILVYDPQADAWSWGTEIPETRRRGGAGAAIHDGKLYLVCGIQNGHWDGWVNWLDRLDLETNTWEELADAPRVRDHFQAAFVGNKLYAAGGRQTSGLTKQVFDLTIGEVDVFDVESGNWSTLPETGNLPTPRAGCFAFVLGTELLIAGGESTSQKPAHAEVQALDTKTGQWRTASTLTTGRHGTGVVQWKDALYTCAGSGGRGGGPELDSTEILHLKMPADEVAAREIDPKQAKWYEKYKGQQNIPKLEAMLLNTDPEPELTEGFTPMFNGKDLSGWSPKGGTCKFEAKNDTIIGTCVPGSNSTYLCTERTDFTDFIFTCEMKWEADGNSGVMFRAQLKTDKSNETVFGPQAEMEGITGDRFWSGGIYGQSCGGYFYPLWLKEHQAARDALKRDDWNRLTIMAKGNVVKTWINGVPAAHWVDDGTYPQGFFGLQIHKGNQGTVLWKHVRVKELKE